MATALAISVIAQIIQLYTSFIYSNAYLLIIMSIQLNFQRGKSNIQ